MSTSVHQYRGLNAQSTDNEEEDYPPQLTTLTHEIEKCNFNKKIFKLKFIFLLFS